MKRIAILTLLLAAAFSPLRAQVATVEVSRPYDVNLDGILKPAIPISVDDSLQRFDVRFDYSIFNRPYSDLYDFTPYETIQLSTVGANRTPWLFARLGSQYAFGEKGPMPAGELYLQSKPRNGFCSGLYARHNSFFGDLKHWMGDDWKLNSSRIENTVGGDLTYDWATGELMFDLKYDMARYKYRPVNDPNLLEAFNNHANDSFTGAINLNSAQKEENTVYYDVTLSYRNTQKTMIVQQESLFPVDTAKISEGLLTVNGYVGASFEQHRIYIDMNIEFAKYAGVHDFQIGVVEFSPIYKYQRKRLDAKLGVKFGTRYGLAGEIEEDGLDLTARSSIFPDVDLRYTLIDKSLWVHAVVTGGNDLNPYSRMIDDCPLVMPYAQMRFGSRPLDATLSLESVLGGRLGLNLEGNYKIYKNKMIYVPYDFSLGQNLITTAYRDVNQFSVQGEVFWRSQDVTVGGRLRYASYKNAEDKSVVTEMPAWTGNAFVRYNFRERIIAQIACNYRSATGGMVRKPWPADDVVVEYSVPSIVDVDLDVNYLINNHFSVFAKVGNLLNHRNQYMPLTLEPGINFGGGVCINF